VSEAVLDTLSDTPGRSARAVRLDWMPTEVVHALPARQPVNLTTDGTRIIASGPVTCTLLALPRGDYREQPRVLWSEDHYLQRVDLSGDTSGIRAGHRRY
jgi:hypothetical protein